MNVEEFYEQAEGNYSDVVSRISKEERIIKYLHKFADSNAPKLIRDALDASDYETAFRESHNLKGMCLNMSITKLGQLSSDLTESLRNGPTGDVEGFFRLVKEEYDRVSAMASEIDSIVG